MSEIVSLLMRRDGVSEWEAKERVRETLNEIDFAIAEGGGDEQVEDIVMEYLGLEPDYLSSLLFGL